MGVRFRVSGASWSGVGMAVEWEEEEVECKRVEFRRMPRRRFCFVPELVANSSDFSVDEFVSLVIYLCLRNVVDEKW